MKKILTALFIILSLFSLKTSLALAEDSCSTVHVNLNPSQTIYSGKVQKISFQLNESNLTIGETYKLMIDNGLLFPPLEIPFTYNPPYPITITVEAAGKSIIDKNWAAVNRLGTSGEDGTRHVHILRKDNSRLCEAGTYKIESTNDLPSSCNISITPKCVDKNTNSVTINFDKIIYRDDDWTGFIEVGVGRINGMIYSINNGTYSLQRTKDQISSGSNDIYLNIIDGATKHTACKATLTKFDVCKTGDESLSKTGKIENNLKPTEQKCADGNDGIITSLGCIPTNPAPFIGWLFGLAISIGGGIAFLLLSWGSFLLITSSGNPEQLKSGQEIIVSAGAGLLFIIFSVFLLNLIGVNILQIPGFS